MPVTQEELEAVIRAAIQVTYVNVEDNSGGCGEKYAVLIVSKDFEGKTTLARHRMVNEVLKTQIAQIHAFTQKTLTPQQWEDSQKASNATS
ncbi:bola-like protein [Russula ochroleuca]|uniref:Bola-like protein n=1 Tax=Russula ochroleuca TaxID=152965 RepID=A0A9P5MLY7_9AGAM|nr:bola-like protein [Russula ochroleuca]KAF8486922.1 bola-like protein [Russula ochroleuca]